MNPGGRLRALLAAAGAAAVLVAPACGGGGGGGPTSPPPPPQPTLVFTPGGGAGANSIALTRMGQGADRLSLQVQATGVTELYGVSFDLEFPAAVLRFVEFDEGPFLADGGAFDTSVQVVESPAGNLVVGATRLGPVGGASGDGVVLVLHFDAVAAGNGPIAFDSPRAFDRNNPQVGVGFVGGSVQVTR